MDSGNTSNWTNGSGFLENVVNISFELSKHNPPKTVGVLNIGLLLCVLGLPGNLLVIVVYMRKMTTSTRVYMFALAVGDTAVCVCGIFLITTAMDSITTSVFVFALNTSVTFTAYMLVFVSIERLIAVRRPHSFNVKVQRAKKILLILVVAAVVYAMVIIVTGLIQYQQVSRILGSWMLFMGTLIMTTCYILIATTLLKRARSSRNRIAVACRTGSPQQGPSHVIPKGKETIIAEGLLCQKNAGFSNKTMKMKAIRPVKNDIRPFHPGQSQVSTTATETLHMQSSCTTIPGAGTAAPATATNKTVANQSKTYSSVTLLFIITVVFIACWLPQWITAIGITMPDAVRRIFVVNSVVNPFIYGVASAMFREDVRQFYRQTRVKLSACYH